MKEFTSQQFQNQKLLLQRSQTIMDGRTHSAFAERSEGIKEKELRKHLNGIRAMSFTIVPKNISTRNCGSDSAPLNQRLSAHYKFGSDGSRTSRARSRSPEDKISSCSDQETSTEAERVRMMPALNIRPRGSKDE